MKRKIALLLAGCMSIISLAGCGENKNGGSEPSDMSAANGTSEAQSTGEEKLFADKDPYTIKIMMYGDAETAECEKISETISEITREKINADVEITRVSFGTYDTQLNLALSSQEEVDLFTPMSLSLSTLVNSGQIMPLDDLLQSYGNEMYQQIPESDWRCVSIDGEIYEVPNNKEKASDYGFVMRKDILEETGVKVEDIKDFDDLHELFKQVKGLYPDMYPVVPDFNLIFKTMPYDRLGDGFGVLDLWTDPESTTVVNKVETQSFRDWCDMIYGWTQEGIVMPDAASNSESAASIIKSGKGFGYFSHMKPGFEAEAYSSIGYEMVSWKFQEALSTTGSVGIGWCISNSSGDPERAMAFLNLMYTDPEIANLCINGIEGTHYEVKDAQNGIIGYPDGVDSTSVGYSRLAWAWPNEIISYVWETDAPEIWTQLKAFNEGAKDSPAKGFTFDNSMVLNQVTACTNVDNKYLAAVTSGSLNPAEALPEYIAELKSAGIDKIIEEKQSQLDEWLKNNQ